MPIRCQSGLIAIHASFDVIGQLAPTCFLRPQRRPRSTKYFGGSIGQDLQRHRLVKSRRARDESVVLLIDWKLHASRAHHVGENADPLGPSRCR